MVHDFAFLHRILDSDPLGKGRSWEHQGKGQDQAEAEYRLIEKFMGFHTTRIMEATPLVYILMLISKGTKKVLLFQDLNIC